MGKYQYIQLLVSSFLLTVMMLGCGGGSAENSPLTVADYERMIEDVNTTLQEDIIRENSTYWGSSIKYYSFSLSENDGDYIQFFDNGDLYNGIGVSVSSDYEEIIRSFDYTYKIDNNDKLTVNINYGGNVTIFSFVPNKQLDRVEGDYLIENNNTLGYFTTILDGRAFNISSLRTEANNKITSYEAMIDTLNYVPPASNSSDTLSNDLTASTNGTLTCGSYTYVFNSTAKGFADNYTLATNENSTMTLSSLGTGYQTVYQLNSFGGQTNTVDYSLNINSWGLVVDSHGDYLTGTNYHSDGSTSEYYYLIIKTDESNHNCERYAASVNGSNKSLDYWNN